MKEVRKAKMDAKKAAIRDEDMDKGIFIPARSMIKHNNNSAFKTNIDILNKKVDYADFATGDKEKHCSHSRYK